MVSPESAAAVAAPPALLSADLDDLGVTFGPDGGTLRVWSGSADAVELVVFDDTDLDWITDTLPLVPVGGGVWSVTTPLLRPGARYAIRVDGPLGDGQHVQPRIAPPRAVLARSRQRRVRGLALRRGRRLVRLGRRRASPRVPMDRTVIYEGHLKGLSKRHPGVPPALHGTYAGLAHPAMIEHFLSLGVTSIELLPVHAFATEPRLLQHGLANYWGYNTLNFFTPHARLRDRREPPAGTRGDPPRVQGHGEAPARGGPRGDPRRRLQPHLRGGPRRAAHEPARHRQPQLLPPARRRRVHRCHRLRQLGRTPRRMPRPAWSSTRCATGRTTCRSTASASTSRRRSAATRAHHFTPEHPLLRAIIDDPALAGREEDRRAVGCRHGRLADRQLRRRLERVERPLPRSRPQLLAERRGLRPPRVDGAGRHRRLRDAARRIVQHVQPRARPARERQLRHRARRLHAARPRLVRRQAQPRQRRAQPRRRRHQPVVQPRRRGPDRRRGDPRHASQGDAQPARHAAAVGRHPDAHRGRRVRPLAARQQQRVLPRLRAHLAVVGSRAVAAGPARRTCGASSGSGARTPRCARSASRASTSARRPRRSWTGTTRRRDDVDRAVDESVAPHAAVRRGIHPRASRSSTASC